MSDYTLLDRIEVNKWDPVTQSAVSGVQQRVRWTATDTVFTVFLPDAQLNATNLDAAIRMRGATEDALGALGGSS